MNRIFNYILLVTLFVSCKGKEEAEAESPEPVVTPVTVTTIGNEPMEESVELNATSTFLQKWIIRANATGYLKTTSVQLNKMVGRGQTLYTVKTKEAESIGNTINILDSGFRFSGVNSIRANGTGFVSQIDKQPGDYVQDGDQLAVITDITSFVFLLNMPYELRPYIMDKKSLELLLPDGEKLVGVISGGMPSMDAGSQTQSIVLRVNSSHPIPENLIATVKVIKSAKTISNSLPKSAVLADETQTAFWVMKMLNDSTAVKTPVTKGIETNDRIEILAPVFAANDRILTSGNFGLSDTALVRIVPGQ
ncbi:MAG: HlyD family efflux transporter periplasmic adaptor subunit [Ferruginibacter sp.]